MTNMTATVAIAVTSGPVLSIAFSDLSWTSEQEGSHQDHFHRCVDAMVRSMKTTYCSRPNDANARIIETCEHEEALSLLRRKVNKTHLINVMVI